MFDQYKRDINYLRISVTDRCNLRCKYCMPEDGINKVDHHNILRNEEIVEIVKAGRELGINKVRLTGGEPLIRKGIVDLISDISKIEGIDDLAITTNGYLLKELGKDLYNAGLKRINISIDSLREDRYRKITRGGDLNTVIEGIKLALGLGFDRIKLNTVLIGGFNDDEIPDFYDIAYRNDIHVRFIELMPIGLASKWSSGHFLSNKIILDLYPQLVQISDNEIGPSKIFSIPEGKGKIGLINPISEHFCNSCNRIRVTSRGKIKPCLHSDYEIDIKEEINNGKELINILKSSIVSKPYKHYMNDLNYVPIIREMYEIGG